MVGVDVAVEVLVDVGTGVLVPVAVAVVVEEGVIVKVCVGLKDTLVFSECGGTSWLFDP
jgi:hypothetical protein